jgi:DNA invertase Pin-like site-specific DNA recombinase
VNYHGILDNSLRVGQFLERDKRTMLLWLNLPADWCERGVRGVAVTQQIDLSGTLGRMVASDMFGLGEIELEFQRERQAAGIAVAKQKGVCKGRRSGTAMAPPAWAQELHAHGLTVPEIANAMAVNKRTVFRYLSEAK